MKYCYNCKETKPKSEFPKNKSKHDGLTTECRTCNRKLTIKRVRSKNGLISKIYSSQKSKSRKRNHPQPEYDLNWLKEWCLSQELYHKLHSDWVESGYNKWLIPSIDRIDDNIHYTKSNIQLMTWKENDIKGKRSTMISVIQMDMNNNFIKEWESISEACRALDLETTKVSAVCKGNRVSTKGYKWRYK